MQNEVEYRTSLVPKSLPDKRQIFANHSVSTIKVIQYVLHNDNEPQSFRAADSNASFPTTTASVDENATEPLQIPLALAGVKGSGKVTVTLTASSEGESSPAIEGTDFVIENKEIVFEDGCGVQNVIVRPIDNDVFTGKKTFKIIISATSPKLLESEQNSVLVTIVDDEHPWAAIIGTYNITGISAFDEVTPVSVPAVISASDEDTNVLNVNFGYGTLAKMSVEEVDGEIVVVMKDNQYIGPMPKPTDAWNRYFRATHVEGEDLYTVSALAGIFENGVITFEYGFGFQAIHPSTGASGGFFTLLMDGVVATKAK